MRSIGRIALRTTSVLWAASFMLATYVNISSFGSFFGPGPIDAHDLPDLVFWAVLMAWIYVTPLLFFFIGLIRWLSAKTKDNVVA